MGVEKRSEGEEGHIRGKVWEQRKEEKDVKLHFFRINISWEVKSGGEENRRRRAGEAEKKDKK